VGSGLYQDGRLDRTRLQQPLKITAPMATTQAPYWDRGRPARREAPPGASKRVENELSMDQSRLTALMRAGRPRSQ
jgi:hypothetical protein